jgi:hypothetical protein
MQSAAKTFVRPSTNWGSRSTWHKHCSCLPTYSAENYSRETGRHILEPFCSLPRWRQLAYYALQNVRRIDSVEAFKAWSAVSSRFKLDTVAVTINLHLKANKREKRTVPTMAVFGLVYADCSNSVLRFLGFYKIYEFHRSRRLETL